MSSTEQPREDFTFKIPSAKNLVLGKYPICKFVRTHGNWDSSIFPTVSYDNINQGCVFESFLVQVDKYKRRDIRKHPIFTRFTLSAHLTAEDQTQVENKIKEYGCTKHTTWQYDDRTYSCAVDERSTKNFLHMIINHGSFTNKKEMKELTYLFGLQKKVTRIISYEDDNNQPAYPPL